MRILNANEQKIAGFGFAMGVTDPRPQVTPSTPNTGASGVPALSPTASVASQNSSTATYTTPSLGSGVSRTDNTCVTVNVGFMSTQICKNSDGTVSEQTCGNAGFGFSIGGLSFGASVNKCQTDSKKTEDSSKDSSQ